MVTPKQLRRFRHIIWKAQPRLAFNLTERQHLIMDIVEEKIKNAGSSWRSLKFTKKQQKIIEKICKLAAY